MFICTILPIFFQILSKRKYTPLVRKKNMFVPWGNMPYIGLDPLVIHLV